MGLRNQDIEVHEELINEMDLFVVTVKGYIDFSFVDEDAALARAIQIEEMAPAQQNLLELRLIGENYRLDSFTVVDGGQS